MKSLQADAFRGHGFSLLVAALPAGPSAHVATLLPLESPPYAHSSYVHMVIQMKFN